MPTQIVPTPVIKGKMAVQVYNEANQKRSDAAQRGARKLAEKFNSKVKRNLGMPAEEKL